MLTMIPVALNLLGVSITVLIIFLLRAMGWETKWIVCAAVLTLIPRLCIITLIVINVKATSFLRRKGLNPGLLGVSDSKARAFLKSIENLPSMPATTAARNEPMTD